MSEKKSREELPLDHPLDHPMAPFDPELELAMIRESIDSGERGTPYRQVFEELYRKHDFGPLPPE